MAAARANPLIAFADFHVESLPQALLIALRWLYSLTSNFSTR